MAQRLSCLLPPPQPRVRFTVFLRVKFVIAAIWQQLKCSERGQCEKFNSYSISSFSCTSKYVRCAIEQLVFSLQLSLCSVTGLVLDGFHRQLSFLHFHALNIKTLLTISPNIKNLVIEPGPASLKAKMLLTGPCKFSIWLRKLKRDEVYENNVELILGLIE